MSERNQTASANATVGNAIDWDKVDLQKVIQAGNQGRLGGPLTKWLVDQAWNLGKFVVKDNFVIDVSRKAKVKISGLGSNFKAWLINNVEDMPLSTKLSTFILPEAMYDKDIIAKIGGVAKAITSMGEMFHLMELQPFGPDSDAGQLLTNGNANIFYVPQAVTRLNDKQFSYIGLNGEVVPEELEDSQYLFGLNGQWYVLRAVDGHWRGDGWRVNAFSVEFPYGWRGGRCVFSRNSVLNPSATVSV